MISHTNARPRPHYFLGLCEQPAAKLSARYRRAQFADLALFIMVIHKTIDPIDTPSKQNDRVSAVDLSQH